ncbi:hypothetical protein GCM10010245_68980 [Streptomyces spectabilis]|nr:hypothetical protein GCM10010245_68980 [Streptomyces spectabilis]
MGRRAAAPRVGAATGKAGQARVGGWEGNPPGGDTSYWGIHRIGHAMCIVRRIHRATKDEATWRHDAVAVGTGPGSSGIGPSRRTGRRPAP